MKRNLLTILFFILFTTIYTQGQGLYLSPTRYTSTGVTVFNIPDNCYGGSGIKLYVNNQVINATQNFCLYGICIFSYPFGTLKVGDQFYFKDGCGNQSTPVTVEDDYVYVEVPNGSSYTGNGITNIDETPPYSALSAPVVVGKCSPISINSHALHRFIFHISNAGNGGTYTSGVFKLNGTPITSSLASINKLGYPSRSVSISGGAVTYNGDADISFNQAFSGRTPITIEYIHNGVLPSIDQEFTFGPLGLRIWNNNSITVKEYRYDGNTIETNLAGNYTNSTFKITFDTGYFKLFIDGTEVKSIRRTVIYGTSSGTLSNTNLLDYATGVTWTPSGSGEQWVGATVDGVRYTRQKFQVAEDMVVNESVTNVGCNGGSNGSITVNVTGGHPELQYSKDGTTYGSSNVFSGLTAGSYTIYVRDASGCSTSKSINVTENGVLGLSASASNVNCSGGSDGSVSLNASGGAGFYQYKLEGGTYGNSNTITGLTAGTKTFWVKDAAGCEKSTTAIIGVNSALDASIALTNLNCYGDNSGSMTITQTGTASGGVQYSLDGINYQGSNVFSNLAANTYTVYIKDNLCTISKPSQAIAQPNLLVPTVTVSKVVSCNGLSNGEISVAPTGGTSNYQFSLDGNFGGTPAATGLFQNLAAGNYKVWVKDSKGCVKDQIVTISQPATLTASIGSKADVTCYAGANGSAVVNVSGGNGGDNFSIGATDYGTNGTVGTLKKGNYTITVTDGKGCQTTTSVEILEPTKVIVNPSITKTVTCNGGNDGIISVSATGGTGTLRYALNGGTFGTSSVFNNLYAGTYIVNVKDANDCPMDSIGNVLSEPTLIEPTATISNVLCYGGNDGKVVVKGIGGVGNYTFSKDGSSYSTDSTFTGFVAGTYTFYVKDGNACVKSITQTVGQATELTVSLTNTQNVWCYGGKNGKITTNTNGGGTTPYQFSLNGTNYVNSTQTSHLIDTLMIGTYTVWVKDTHGCVKQTNSVTLTDNPLIIPSIASQTNVSCKSGSNGSVTLSQTGGYGSFTYNINGGTFVTSPTFSGLVTGTFNFILRDAYGCEKTISTTVSEPTSPYTINKVNLSNLSCYQNKTGRIEVSNAGGTSPYRTWITSAPTDTIRTANATYSNLSATTYTIHGKDAKDCAYQYVFSLTQPTDISISLLSKKDVNCEAYSRGEAQVFATGSNEGFNYTLSGKDFQNNSIVPITNSSGFFGSLKAGDYIMTATDKDGCQKPYTVSIVPKTTNINFDVTKTLPTSCLSTDGSINLINVTGGRQPYQYSLSGQGFSGSPNFTNLLNGVYVVTVADSLCSYKKEVDLKLPGSINAGYTITPISCGVSNANLSISPITGGNGNYQLSINTGVLPSSNVFSNLSPNVYSVSIQDSPLTCKTVLGIEIKEQNRADLQFKQRVNILCYGNNTGVIEVAGNNNLAPYQYAINNKNGGYGGSGVFSNLTANTYKLYAKNNVGCIDSLEATLTQPPLLVNTTNKTDNLCFGDSTGAISISGSGGVSPYSFSIDGNTYQTGGNFTILKANGYTTYIKDQHQCIKTQSVTLIQPSDVIVSPQYADTVRCWGESNGKVLVLASGGTPSYQYSMDNTNYSPTNLFQNLPVGNYTFYVKDDHQCLRKNTLALTQPDSLKLSLASKTDPLCYQSKDGKIKVSAIGGNGNNAYTLNSTLTQSSPNFESLPQNTYQVVVVDRKGCTHQVNNIQLTHPTKLEHSTSLVEPLCYKGSDGKVTIRSVGGTPKYKVQIDGNTFLPTSPFTDTFVFEKQPSRDYTFAVIDSNNCIDAFSLRLGQPTRLTTEARITENLCHGDSTGIMSLFGQGATPPYQYSIVNGYNLEDTTYGARNYFDKLLAKSYLVRLKDSHECRYDTTVVVKQPTLITFASYLADSVRCYKEANGKINIKAEGGTPSYLYSLDNSNYQSSDTIKNLKEGYYKLFVKDKNACVVTHKDSFYVAQPQELKLSVSAQSDPLCIGEKNGKIELKAIGGNAQYTYLMDNTIKQRTALFDSLSQGSYTFKVNDWKGCEDTVTLVTLKWPQALAAQSIVTQPKCVGEDNGAITLNLNGGVMPYQIKLDTMLYLPKDTTYTIQKLAAGKYNAQVQDKNGCQLILPLSITQPDALLPVKLGTSLRTGDSIVVCQGQKVELAVNNPNQLVNWYFNNKTIDSLRNKQTIEVDKPGKYVVQVMNSSGCMVKDSFNLQNNQFALKADFLIPTQAFVGDTVVCLDITKPIPDKVTWLVPSSNYVLSTNKSMLVFVPTKDGEESIGIIAQTGGCSNLFRRSIKIFDRGDIDKTDTQYHYNEKLIQKVTISPNPNNGIFNAKVFLTKPTSLILRLIRVNTGESVYYKEVQPTSQESNSINEYPFNLYLLDGMYTLTVTAKNQTETIRFAIIND